MRTVLVDWDVCGANARLTRRYMGRLHSWPKLRFLKLMKRVKWRGDYQGEESYAPKCVRAVAHKISEFTNWG